MNSKFLYSSSYYLLIIVNLSFNNMVYVFLLQRLLLIRFSKARKNVVLERHCFTPNKSYFISFKWHSIDNSSN